MVVVGKGRGKTRGRERGWGKRLGYTFLTLFGCMGKPYKKNEGFFCRELLRENECIIYIIFTYKKII